jgi:hypothetical protein
MEILIILFIVSYFVVRRRRRTFWRGTNLRKYLGDFHGVYILFGILALLACSCGDIPEWVMILVGVYCVAGVVGVAALGSSMPGYRRHRRRR